MSLTTLFKDTVTPYTATLTTDSIGGAAKTWVAGTPFSGRLSLPSRGQQAERLFNDKVTMLPTHRLYCAATETLTEEMQVEIESVRYQVLAVYKPSLLATDPGHLEVDLMKVEGTT